jgi:hypothetical protein
LTRLALDLDAPARVGGQWPTPILHQLPLSPKHFFDVESLSHCAAVALFMQRTQALKPDFDLTGENASPVAAICTQLDGLPLAIELAAARIKLLPPQALLARLTNRLQVLTGGRQDAPIRQQTLLVIDPKVRRKMSVGKSSVEPSSQKNLR